MIISKTNIQTNTKPVIALTNYSIITNIYLCNESNTYVIPVLLKKAKSLTQKPENSGLANWRPENKEWFIEHCCLYDELEQCFLNQSVHSKQCVCWDTYLFSFLQCLVTMKTIYMKTACVLQFWWSL